MEPDHVRTLALALEGASEAPHMHRVAFRTPRKIFLTMGEATRDVTFLFDPDLRDFYCEQAPEAFRYMSQARHIGKVVLTVPAALDPTKDIEVVVFLHGYTESSDRPYAGFRTASTCRTAADPPSPSSTRPPAG